MLKYNKVIINDNYEIVIYDHFWFLNQVDKKELQIAIGKRIRDLRELKNISQVDLAYACNFEKSNLSRIESGRTSPNIYTLYTIANKLEVELSELFQFEKK